MSLLDDLPADQRAVLSLVLSRGRSYDEIATMLSISRAAVRDRALAALDALGPPGELAAPERAVLTDYLLGQLPPQVAEQTRVQLAGAGPQSAWVSARAQALAPLTPDPLPSIPVSAPAGPPDAASAPDSGDTPRPDAPVSSRRGGMALLVGAGVVVAAALAVVLVLVNRSSPAPVPAHTTTVTSGRLTILGRVVMLPLHTSGSFHPAGIAELVRDRSQLGVVLVARGLPANSTHNAYAVWLTNASGASSFIGFVRSLVGTSGKLTADGLLPSDAAAYSRLLLTLETRQHPSTPGSIVLAGTVHLPG